MKDRQRKNITEKGSQREIKRENGLNIWMSGITVRMPVLISLFFHLHLCQNASEQGVSLFYLLYEMLWLKWQRDL